MIYCFPMCCLARSTCFYACLHVYLSFLHVLCFMPCFPMSLCLFFSRLMLGLHAHILDIMSMVMPCLDIHVCMDVLCSYAYAYASVCLFPCLYILYAFCHIPCACVLHAMFVCLGLDLFFMPCAIVALLSHFLSFLLWPNG